MLIGGRKIVNTDSFYEATNIRENVQNDSSEFEGLLHEMMSKEPFINQEISYINFDGERKLSTVSNFINAFLSINDIENIFFTYAITQIPQLNYFLINLLCLLMD